MGRGFSKTDFYQYFMPDGIISMTEIYIINVLIKIHESRSRQGSNIGRRSMSNF